jgi:uncharacterized protein (DUF2062 family)
MKTKIPVNSKLILRYIRDKIKKRVIEIRGKLISIPADPKKVSLGYALGVFLASTPFIGVKVPIAIFLTTLLKWNRIASIIGVFHVNLLTAPLFYGFSYLAGRFVLGQETVALPCNFTMKACHDLFAGNCTIFLDLLVGGCILGVPLAFAAYFFSFSIIRRKRKIRLCGSSVFRGECISSIFKTRRTWQNNRP